MVIEHNNIFVKVLSFKLQWLPSSIIIDTWPWNCWPSIVHLPIKSTITEWFCSSLSFNCNLDPICLNQTTCICLHLEIYALMRIHWHIFCEGSKSTWVSFMKSKRTRFILSICLSCKLYDRFVKRERLSSKFTIETPKCCLVRLERWSACPNTPIMYISSVREASVAYSSWWRWLNVRNIVALDIQDIGNELYKKFLIIFIILRWRPTPWFYSL